MKIRKTSPNQNSIIALNFLQTKNYFLHDFKLKNMQLAFVKGLKIIYKYNACNKKIVFINVLPTVITSVKHFIDKTKHEYLLNIRRFLINKLHSEQSLPHKKDLLILLNTKVSGHLKIPSLWIGDYWDFGTSYNIVGNFLFKKSKYFLFFICLQSIIRRLS